jgi:secondary thiamine-phosphate synthase enzyme
MLTELLIRTGSRTELVDITSQVQDVVSASDVMSGVCYITIPHTTAGLTLNENWDPSVRDDILRALDTLVPRVGDYRHAEGNSPAHIKSILTGHSLVIMVENASLSLGTWQGIYLAEYDGPRQRRVFVKVISE